MAVAPPGREPLHLDGLAEGHGGGGGVGGRPPTARLRSAGHGTDEAGTPESGGKVRGVFGGGGVSEGFKEGAGPGGGGWLSVGQTDRGTADQEGSLRC